MATALGPLDGILRAYLTGAKPPGGGPSWRSGMSLTLAMPGLFLMKASVIVLCSQICPLFLQTFAKIHEPVEVEIGKREEK